MRFITRQLFLIAILLVFGCTHLPSKKDQALTSASWQANGKVSVFVDKSIYPHAERSQQTLIFTWQQHNDNFLISLSGSFGFGKTLIRQQDGIVSIERGNKVLGRANDPERLLTDTTGLHLPIAGLQYWILGLPSTAINLPLHTNASLGCDNTNEAPCAIPDFHDQGWEVVIRSTQSVGAQVLPRRLKASVEGISLNAVINQWRQAPSAAAQKS